MPIQSAIVLQPVTSSQFTHVGYDGEAVLAIRFNPSKKCPQGSLYYFEPVEEGMFEDFIQSKSLGSYFAQHIKGNKAIAYRKIDEEEPAPIAAPLPPPAAEQLEFPRDEQGLRERALAVQSSVQAFVIATAAQYEQAAGELLRLVRERKVAQARVDEIKRPAYATYQATLKLEKEVIFPYDAAERWLKLGMGLYREQEEAERRRAEQALKAEREREARAEEAERARQHAENDARIAEAQGNKAAAEKIRMAPLAITPIRPQPAVMPREVPRVKGIIETTRWAFRVTDPGLVPDEYWEICESKIRRVVDALKGGTNIPGVEVWSEASTGVRA